eukprot:6412448-Prymnesium_polylepis.1
MSAILKDPKDPTKVSLLYANQTEDDILVRDMLDALAAKHPTRMKVPRTSAPAQPTRMMVPTACAMRGAHVACSPSQALRGARQQKGDRGARAVGAPCRASLPGRPTTRAGVVHARPPSYELGLLERLHNRRHDLGTPAAAGRRHAHAHVRPAADGQ